MKLKDLLKGVSVLEWQTDPERNIENVEYDSRKVTEGDLFVAISGFAADGGGRRGGSDHHRQQRRVALRGPGGRQLHRARSGQ